MKNLRIYSFFIGLVVALVAAWLLPTPGASGGLLRPELTTRIGIAIIFLNLGLVLPTEKLLSDLLEWRLHVFVQACTYLVFPLVLLTADLLWRPFLHPDLRIGFLYLAILPTTISTAVVFTMNAHGNLTAAVFNTSLSNILAVFIVPTWMVWVLALTKGLSVPFLPLFLKIVLLLIVPLVVGQFLRPFVGRTVDGWKPWIGRINTGIIFFLIYAAFCDSVLSGVWQELGLKAILQTLAIAAVLLVTFTAFVWWTSGRLGLDVASRRAALFCGSQKSLATGVAMAPAIFGTTLEPQALSLVLLPILCFHPLQLLLGGWLVAAWQPRKK